MKTCALLFANTLVGQELRERLSERPDLCRELRLLTLEEDEIGGLSEFRGAALVQRLEAGGLDDVDLLFVAGWSPEIPKILEERPASCRVVLLAPASVPGAPEVVDSVNLEIAAGADLAISPHPAAVLVAHLVQPLLSHGLAELSATVLQPVSMLRETSLEELLDQTRDLLSFRTVEATASLPGQAAFNLYPVPHDPGPGRATFSALWKDAPGIRTRIVQAGVFHCLSASIELRFGEPADTDRVRQALEAHPHVSWWEEDEPLSPVRGASFDDVLVGSLVADPDHPEILWLWAVMDNLTRGGALNAIAIAEQMGKVN